MPGYPAVVELGSWRRDVRYAVAAASVDPGRALAWVMKAEKWRNDVTELPVDREFETLGVKWGKALRAVVKGDKRRELQVLEERVLREKSALLDGPQIYAWINQDFARDARLARAQILQEIAACRVAAGRGALSQFMTQWDTAVERLADAGGREGDDETLYVHFRPNFMACPELAEHASKVRRSLPGSRCHTYEWLYKTAKAHLETARLERQESERMAASRPGAPQPLAPGLEQRRPPPKGAPAAERQKPAPAQPAQPKADTKNLPCPRLVRGVPCNFGEEKCWYSHQAGLVSQAKAALQKPAAKKTTFAPDGGERVCRFMKQYGTCKKGDQCAFSHDVSGKSPATVVLEIGCPALPLMAAPAPEAPPAPTEAELTEQPPVVHLINGHMPPLGSCQICRRAQLTEAPASRRPRQTPDARLVCEAFGNTIDMDTLFLTSGKEGELQEAAPGDATTKVGIVMLDRWSRDIDFSGGRPQVAASARCDARIRLPP